MEKPLTLDIGELEVVLKDVSLPMGLTVNAVTLTGSEIHLEKEPFKIEASAPGKLTVLILAHNLAAFLNKESPGGLKDFEVELRDGKIYAQASMRMIVEVRASAVCTLDIQNGSALNVVLESVDVMGVGAKNLVQGQLDKINPVIETKDLPVEATLTGYEISDGKLILHGDVHPRLVKQ